MIKRQLLATVSCLALTGAASAADMRMPVKAAPAPVVTQIWAGPYIGINGGAVWHRLEADRTANPFPPFAYATETTKAVGGTFGGQIGYNWQSQNFVYGLEADLNWVGAKGSVQQNANNGIGAPSSFSTNLSWLATVRARAGVTLGTHTLVFATGGLAVGGVKNSWLLLPPFNCGGVTCQVSDSETRVGWTAGGGIERFISNPHITVKAEVLYVDLGRETVTGNGGYTARFDNTAVVGRLGLNLKW